MLRRAAPIVAVALAAAACGGSPTAPALVIPAPYVLTAGSYTLNIFPATSSPSGPVACMTAGSGAGTNIAIPVDVQQDGRIWIGRPPAGTLELTLVDVSPAAYSGALKGSFTLGGTTMTAGSGGDPAFVFALTLGASWLTGPIDGAVIYTSGGSQSSCTANSWSLVRR